MHLSILKGMRMRTNRLSYWFFPFILFFWGFAIDLAFGATAKNLAPVLSNLEAHIQNYVQKKRIAGCAIAVVYRNEVVFMHSYGVKTIGKNDKIDLDTVFQLGSVSKPMAATLVSILENKGHLRLEDPVTHYLPTFSLKSLQSPNVLKIKHILSHSTGVPRAGFNNLIESHASYDRILTALQSTPVRTPVGKRYDYHNAMFSLISEITHSATLLTFKDALKINLLKPLNMSNTSSTLDGLMNTHNRASPHTLGRRGALIPCDTYSKGYYTVAPAGGINSSIRDMANFLKAQLGGYPQVLSPKTLTRIHTPQIMTSNNVLSPYEGPAQLIKNARYGLGWRIVDFANHKMVFHGGWVKGFTNFIAFMPDQQIGIVVLHNGETRFSSKTAVKFFEMFMDVPKRKISILQKKMSTPRRKIIIQRKKTILHQKKSLTQRKETILKPREIYLPSKKAHTALPLKNTGLPQKKNTAVIQRREVAQLPQPKKEVIIQRREVISPQKKIKIDKLGKKSKATKISQNSRQR